MRFPSDQVHHNSEDGNGTDEGTHDGVEHLIIHIAYSTQGLDVNNEASVRLV